MPESLTLDTRAGRFAALAEGDASAPPILLLHGFPDTPFGWRPVMSRLAAAGFRAVAPYTRGYHPSPADGPFHLDRLADDALAFADALSLGRPLPIVGHDWGAMTAYVALARSPGRFSRAITLSVPHPAAFVANLLANPLQLRRSAYMVFFQLGSLAEREVARADFELVDRLWSTWSPGFRPPADYLAELHRCLAASMPAPLLYYRALFRPFADALARARQRADVHTPTLYLHGAHDGCIGAEIARGQSRFFRAGLTEHIVPACGHFLQLERPAAIAEHLLAFIRDGLQ